MRLTSHFSQTNLKSGYSGSKIRKPMPLFVGLLPQSLGQLLIFLIVLANSQVFSASVNNPFGIKYCQELVYFFLTVFSYVYVLSQIRKSLTFKKVDLIVLAMVMFAILYSALAAWQRFGQPIHYGIIEERRTLGFLIYFPVVWSLRGKIVGFEQILTWIVVSGLFCAMLSVGFFSGLISPLREMHVLSMAIRGDRCAMGLAYMSFAALIIVQRLVRGRHQVGWLVPLFLLTVILVVGQTRQILISLTLALFVLSNSIRWVFWAAPLTAIGLWLSTKINLLAEFFEKYQTLFAQLVSDQYLTKSYRVLAISEVGREVLQGAWFGSGSLSLMWRDGFLRIYGKYFFLADIGFFGSFYKFGIFAVPLILVYLVTQYRVLQRIRNHSHYRLLFAAWVQLLVLIPVAATVEYRGFVSGLILALSVTAIYDGSPGNCSVSDFQVHESR